MVDESIGPHDTIIIEDVVKEQGRIEYDPEINCF